MTHPAANAAVLWTGGKDSALALHEARQDGCRVRCLVTFAPPEADFLAHPISFMKLQAEALALPHLLWPVREPFDESYEAGLHWLKAAMGARPRAAGAPRPAPATARTCSPAPGASGSCSSTWTGSSPTGASGTARRARR